MMLSSYTSTIYIYFFWSDLCQYLSIISTRCPTEKTFKDTVHFFKGIMLHPSIAPLSNVKLKNVSKVYHVFYNNITGKTTMYKFQCTEEFTRNLCALLYYVYTTMFNQINCNLPRVLIMHFYRLVWFHTQRNVRASLTIRVSNSGHHVKYARTFCRNKLDKKKLLHVSTLHTTSYTSTYSYNSTYGDIFCASLSSVPDIPLYISTLHSTSYAST